MFQVIGCKHPHYVYINTEHMYGKTYENWRCNKCAHKDTILVVARTMPVRKIEQSGTRTLVPARQQLGEWLVDSYLAAKGHVREQQSGEGLGDLEANLEQRPLVGGLAGIERSEALLPRLRPVDDADAHGADCIRLHGLPAESLDFRLQALQVLPFARDGRSAARAAVNAADCQRQQENEVPPRSSGCRVVFMAGGGYQPLMRGSTIGR